MTSSADTFTSKLDLLAARVATDGVSQSSQLMLMAAYGPPQTKQGRISLIDLMAARAGSEEQVVTRISQTMLMAAVGTGTPGSSRSEAWTFVMDGHRFYVLPLGPEGTWAYDTTTQEWCQLQSQGFDGMNFVHGTMWGLRVMGGDSLYTYLYEFDPTQPFDEEWREIQRKVTGGIATRSRASIGVANFVLTASVGDDNSVDMPVSLAFSDDNGVTWSQEFDIPLTDASTQTLIWSALGAFAAPGRVFRITDTAGPVRFDGADAVLTIGSGVDASQDQDGGQK